MRDAVIRGTAGVLALAAEYLFWASFAKIQAADWPTNGLMGGFLRFLELSTVCH